MIIPEAEQCQLHTDEIIEFDRITNHPDLIDLHTSNLPRFDEHSPFEDLRYERFKLLTQLEPELSVEALALFATATKRFVDILKREAPGARFDNDGHIAYIKELAQRDPIYMTNVEEARDEALRCRDETL